MSARLLNNITEVRRFLSGNGYRLLYITTEHCNSCRAFLPKLEDYLSTSAPQIKLSYVRVDEMPALAGELMIMSAPCLLLYIDGKIAWDSRGHVSIYELHHAIKRLQ